MFGRQKIFSDVSVVTSANVEKVLKEALISHSQNSNECDNLYEYYKGNQPILERVKKIRPEINNKIVENRANEIVSFKTGYLCGEPMQYVSRGSTDEISEGISVLNDYMVICGKPARDKELIEWMYICGVGYRAVMPNSAHINTKILPHLKNEVVAFSEDEAPFNIYTLDPRNAFVVYHSGLGEKPLMGVIQVLKQDNSVVYSVYTPYSYFELVSIEKGDPKLTSVSSNPLGEIPIIEYPLNNSRLGSFETVQLILDAINNIQSNRLDAIEQFVQSLMVLYNCEIDEGDVAKIREAGLIKLKSFGENKGDIKIISEQLNQQETQTLIDYMYQTVLNIVGMPNRNGGKSTSDTGSAVVMRDGWENADSRTKADQLMVMEAETKLLKSVLKIMRDTVGTPLKLSDIDIKFTRRNYSNLLVKAQALQSFLQSGIEMSDALALAGVGTDPLDIAKRMKDMYPEVRSGFTDEGQANEPTNEN